MIATYICYFYLLFCYFRLPTVPTSFCSFDMKKTKAMIFSKIDRCYFSRKFKFHETPLSTS